MRRALRALGRQAVILHNHSVWMMPNVYAGWAAGAGSRCRLVVSPHGTLGDWSMRRARWRKELLWRLGQRRLFERAHCFHATAPAEYEEIRRLGFRQPAAIIPNGVDLPAREPAAAADEQRRLVFMARVHPKKGADMLLRVWRRLQDDFPDWTLAIAGPEDEKGYLAALRALGATLDCRRVSFPGPVYGAEKEDFLARSALYVLPSQNENFGITVAEALALGVPAVVSKGAPWQGLIDHECGWWVDNDEASLEAALRQAMRLNSAQRKAMGARGRQWVRQAFAWEGVGEKMRATYAWINSESPDPPEWIWMN
jgi:glycosyltransferase involved in cell wall biosynthesis